MSALERLRSWLSRTFGGSDDSADGTREGRRSDSDTSDGGGLDRSGATETRTTGQDDAVEALRETRRDRGRAGGQDPAADTDDRGRAGGQDPAADTDDRGGR